MSSACTCHINVKECKYCNLNVIQTENTLDVTDFDGDSVLLEKHINRNLSILNTEGASKTVCVVLKEPQIKELMLFLDRKYGYLLEGVK